MKKPKLKKCCGTCKWWCRPWRWALKGCSYIWWKTDDPLPFYAEGYATVKWNEGKNCKCWNRRGKGKS